MRTSTQLSSYGLVVTALLFASFAVAQSSPTNSVAKRRNGSVVAVGPQAEKSQSSDVKSNPLYESQGNSGQNPLYEGKDKAAIKPGTKTSNIQPYKDPEDMTTRYRPGNNKTTVTDSNGASASSAVADHRQKTVENPVGEMKTSDKSMGSAHATEPVQKKHPGNVKYSDFAVTGSK